ncbi:DUF2163 domain-containing protein [Tropicimonas sediminicola]|uniref:Bacteriophage phiJL001 Gp84 C-terminal domain-containing protein n=1 Tax=Tropicimonas sediminicola TaxID=1031541 RepID=A0A239EEP0_9RHOB|nr:DUF2163 domain-containing protein [Tropicimonas sediminicola]SNS42758.1 phage conserved hypothetical protein BR0599 [Tropicimonas sediminicola]
MAVFSASGQRLLEHLASGCTTVCRCWLVVRKDGKQLGFTDHDVDVLFDGMTFAAASGFTASALEQTTGLAVNNTEAVGALSGSAITEDDIGAGRYDGAAVTSWLVNWKDTEDRMVQFGGSLGEVTRSGDLFKAELRGVTEGLNQPQGNVYQSTCSAVLGDVRCGFDTDTPGFALEAIVLSISGGTVLTLPDAGEHEDRWFERGRLVVRDGVASGLIGLVKRDRLGDGARVVELWQALPSDFAVGDTVRLEAGCDKRALTCREKFSNFLNFRGFPHVPGEDWLTAYPKQDDNNDGGSLNG